MMLSVLRVRCERQVRGSALLQALLLDYGGGPNHRWSVNPKIMEPWCLYGGLKRGYAKMERF